MVATRCPAFSKAMATCIAVVDFPEPPFSFPRTTTCADNWSGTSRPLSPSTNMRFLDEPNSSYDARVTSRHWCGDFVFDTVRRQKNFFGGNTDAPGMCSWECAPVNALWERAT